eukprot:Nk52_evm61s266 gene=Nk52_evmTU61s266
MSGKPPPPPPKKNRVEVYKALYDYTANSQDELSFKEGDILYIDDKSDPGWFRGRCGDAEGLIPSNYVESDNAVQMDNPLHEAAKRGNLSFLQELIAARVSVNGLDRAGATPLHWACSGGHTECVEALLAVPQVRVDVPNHLGDTPLHCAAWRGHTDCIRLLLSNTSARQCVRKKNGDGQTPLQLASRSVESAALLQQAEGSVGGAGQLADYGGEDEDSD